MLRMVCNGVETEPVLKDITGEELIGKPKPHQMRGWILWQEGSVRGIGRLSSMYRDMDPNQIYRQHQIEKKREYRSLDILISRIIPSNIGQSAASPYINKTQKAPKL